MPVVAGHDRHGDQGHSSAIELSGQPVQGGHRGDADQGRRQPYGDGAAAQQVKHACHQVHVERFAAGIGGEKDRPISRADLPGHQAVDGLIKVQRRGNGTQGHEPQGRPQQADAHHRIS